ncbi:MAG: PspC domain-containing protein [Bacteroidota bacterium]
MRRLYRSQTNKKIAGICGGIGEMLDVDPTLIRLLTIVALFATGFFPLFFGYIIAMFLVPIGSQPASASSAGPSSSSSAGPDTQQ